MRYVLKVKGKPSVSKHSLRRKLRYAGVDLGAYCVGGAGRTMRKAFMA